MTTKKSKHLILPHKKPLKSFHEPRPKTKLVQTKCNTELVDQATVVLRKLDRTWRELMEDAMKQLLNDQS